MANTITSPDSPAPDFVQWERLEGRGEAKRGLESGEYYAAIVIPKNYSQHLVSLSGPPVGVPPLAQPPVLEPAEIELLTSPAVRPSTTAQIENAFTGIVGGVSGATSEQIFEGLSEQGVPVPQGAGAVISDPVKGNVSEADVSGEAGPLPKAPEPAQIEVFTNFRPGRLSRRRYGPSPQGSWMRSRWRRASGSPRPQRSRGRNLRPRSRP